jgi:glycosyltransferase involved in cell wall biosynthesis
MHVTVLITVYNRERFIADAIDSVIAQDYPDWDILVVDDGSTDQTVEVVKSRIWDDRISLIQMKHGGCGAATAIGIEHARGPVVTELGSDDKLLSDSLSTVMPSFESNSRLGYVWTNWVDSTADKGTGDFLPDNLTLFEAAVLGRWTAPAERFFRKEFYLQSDGLDTSIKYAVDLQLALLIGKTGCDTLHIPKVTYWRRIHPHRISNEHHAEQLEACRLLRRKFSLENPALTELYLVEIEKERDTLEKERDALSGELTDIKNCYGYKFMRLYGPVVDQALPDGTRRGEFKRSVLALLRGRRRGSVNSSPHA